MSDIFDYPGKRDIADRLITKFGAPATVRRTTNSGTPFEPTQSTADFDTLAVKVEFTMKQIQSGNIQSNDERWLVAAGPLTAAGLASMFPGDAIVVGGAVKPVLVASPLAPADVVVMYDCQIRV